MLHAGRAGHGTAAGDSPSNSPACAGRAVVLGTPLPTVTSRVTPLAFRSRSTARLITVVRPGARHPAPYANPGCDVDPSARSSCASISGENVRSIPDGVSLPNTTRSEHSVPDAYWTGFAYG